MQLLVACGENGEDRVVVEAPQGEGESGQRGSVRKVGVIRPDGGPPTAADEPLRRVAAALSRQTWIEPGQTGLK